MLKDGQIAKTSQQPDFLSIQVTHHSPEILGWHGHIEVNVGRHFLRVRAHGSCNIMPRSIWFFILLLCKLTAWNLSVKNMNMEFSYVLRNREVMPCSSCITSPCLTGLGGLLTTRLCLENQSIHITELHKTRTLHYAGPVSLRPAECFASWRSCILSWIFDNPPVVDVFERVARHLLLVRAATPIFISAHS